MKLDTPELQDAFGEGEEHCLRELANAARTMIGGKDVFARICEAAGYTIPNERGEFV